MRPQALIAQLTGSFAQAGLPAPRAEARLLVMHALDTDPVGLLGIAEVPDQVLQLVNSLAVRRLSGEPLQYLMGRTWFAELELRVGPGVFIPRPETETLVELADRALQGAVEPVVVDLCTGSGAIAAVLAGRHPGAVIHAVEGEAAAASWAELNLAGTGVQLSLTGMAQALPGWEHRVDLVTCNPPYIPGGDRAILPAEVVDHEPAEALFAGEDGLDAIRVLLPVAGRLLRPGGTLIFEHDDSQAHSAVDLTRAAGFFEQVHGHPDLTGRARFVSARRTPVPPTA